MCKENTLEHLSSELILIQSKLEVQLNALEALINIAKNHAESEDSDLLYLLEALSQKAENIRNTVSEMG